MLHREPPYNSTMNNAAPASFGTRCWSEQLQYPYTNSYQNNQSGSVPSGSGRWLQPGQCSYSSQQSLAASRLQSPYNSQRTQASYSTSNPYSYPSQTSNFPQSHYSTVQTPYPTENSYQPLYSSSPYPGNQYQPPQQQSPYPSSSSTSSNSSQNDVPYPRNPYNTATYNVAQTSSYPQVSSTSAQRKQLGMLHREPPYNSTMNNNSPASFGTERWTEQSQYPYSNSYQSDQSGSVRWLQPGQCSYSSQQSLAASRLQSPYNSQPTQPRYPPQVPYSSSNPYSSSSPYPPSTAYPSSSYPSTYPYPSQTSNFQQSYYSAGQIPYPTGYTYQPQCLSCPYPGSQYQSPQYLCYYPASYPYPCGNSYKTQSNSKPQGSSTVVRRKGNPTVVPARNFDAVTDANALRKAMKGLGTDENGLINVICQRSNPQRQEIQRKYKTEFERDLIEDITSETSGNFRKVLVGLLLPIVDFYVKELNVEMTGKGTEGEVLIEVLCTLSNAEIHNIKKAYRKTYGRDLESTLKLETSGNFKKLLAPLCAGDRDESYKIDLDSAKNDARNLHNAGELRFGTDESTFNMVLCQRNFQQLKLVFQEYQKLAGHSLEEAIKKEFSGDIEDGLLAIFKCIMDTDEFFATRLHKSMAGIGTNNNQLIRIIITRCEIDLQDIKQKFEKLYGKSLKSWIKGDTSGDYKHALYSLIGEPERTS